MGLNREGTGRQRAWLGHPSGSMEGSWLWSQTWLHRLRAVWPQTNHKPSLSLNFLTFRMDNMNYLKIREVCGKIEVTYKMP